MVESPPPAERQSVWSRIPEVWKLVGVFVAIGAAAIGGYRVLDDVRDELVAADTRFDQRIAGIEGAMVRKGDLGAFVVSDTLDREACLQTMRAQMHEYSALAKAYDELLEAVSVGELAFAGRPLSEIERAQQERVIQLRASFQSRKERMEVEELVLEDRINRRDGC